MPRVITRIGDVFSVKLGNGVKKYFQYVANDLTQLNSDVVRAFKKAYPLEASPDTKAVVEGEVEFYAHTMVNLGVKMGLWEKTGRAADVGTLDILFRDTNDIGDPKVKASNTWYVWRINQEFVHVGKLDGEFRKAEVGCVINPREVVHRLETGQYEYPYPE